MTKFGARVIILLSHPPLSLAIRRHHVSLLSVGTRQYLAHRSCDEANTVWRRSRIASTKATARRMIIHRLYSTTYDTALDV